MMVFILPPFRCWAVDGSADRNGGDGGERQPGEPLRKASGHDGQKQGIKMSAWRKATRTGTVLFLFGYWLISDIKPDGEADRKRRFSQLTAGHPRNGDKLFLTN